MTSDEFKSHATGMTAPAVNSFVVAPSDATDLPFVTRGLYLGQSGDVTLLLKGDDTAVTFSNLAGGVVHPLRVRRVYATDLTAAGLVGIY